MYFVKLTGSEGIPQGQVIGVCTKKDIGNKKVQGHRLHFNAPILDILPGRVPDIKLT